MEEFFSTCAGEHISRIRLHLKSPRFILKRLLGASPAVLVTSGFEDWLDMNLPVVDSHFQLSPSRATSPLDRDLVFGVSERVDTEGNLIQDVGEEELQFLASKLKMLKVKNVAICFLHSHKNNVNVQKTQDFLAEQGFQVFVANEHSEDEKARWWNSILSAYLQPFCEEVLEQIQETLPDSLKETQIDISTSSGFTAGRDLFDITSLFGEPHHIQSALRESGHSSGRVFHFGFEEFYKFELDTEQQNHWLSSYGKVAMKVPRIEPLELQPTNPFEMNFWGVPVGSGPSLGYEPGPMCLGRGVRPTLLDLLYLTGELDTDTLLGPHLNEKSRNRIKENFLSLCEDPQKELTSRDVINSCLELAMRQILMEMSFEEKNILIGPLAIFFRQSLMKLEPKLKIEVAAQHSQLAISSLIQGLES